MTNHVTFSDQDVSAKFPANKICNQKYNIITFLPKVCQLLPFRVAGGYVCVHITLPSSLQVFYEQFKFFINLYFLVVALTQFIPQLRIGYLYTYWAPLVSWGGQG